MHSLPSFLFLSFLCASVPALWQEVPCCQWGAVERSVCVCVCVCVCVYDTQVSIGHPCESGTGSKQRRGCDVNRLDDVWSLSTGRCSLIYCTPHTHTHTHFKAIHTIINKCISFPPLFFFSFTHAFSQTNVTLVKGVRYPRSREKVL